MVDMTEISDTGGDAKVRPTESRRPLLDAIGSELAGSHERLDLYEGAATGYLYAEVDETHYRGEVTETGLWVAATDEPTEEVRPLVRVEPDEDETVADAVRSITFAGD